MFAQGAFTNDANATPEEVARKRAMIAALMPRFGNAKYIGEGIGQLATGYMVGRQNKKLDAQEAAGRQSASEMFDRLFSGGGGFATKGYSGAPSGTWTPDAPAPKPTEAHLGMPDVAGGGLSFGLPKAAPEGSRGLDYGSAVMTPQEMLIAGAEARGLNPIDVATAISYETGGKFDPLIKGPTTQWGQHEGLIQFGDPQGVEHGAVFDQGPEVAWRSQLDPNNGAVWSYLDSVGVQPGMGLDQIYSGINAGGINRMGASDANNGGAPGTVADKVASMGPHREKAAAFLGGTWTSDPNAPQVTMSAQNAPSAPQIPMQDLLAAMANPWLAPEQRAVLSSMYERQVQMADPLYQMQLQEAQMKLDQQRNPGAPEAFTERMFTLNSLGIDPQSEEGKVYLMTGALPNTGEAGKPPQVETFYDEATGQQYKAQWDGQQWVRVGGVQAPDQPLVNIEGDAPGIPPDEEALRTSLGKKEGEAWSTYLDAANVSAGTMQDMQMLDELITMAPQGPITGRLANAFTGINSAADAFNSVVKRVAPTLRAPGSGATSDIEYEGMLKSLPQLSANPEANRAISAMVKAKAQINIERGQVVAAYQNGEIGAAEARKAMTEINSRSIMTPELKAILGQTAPPQPGSDMSEDDAAYLRSLGLEP